MKLQRTGAIEMIPSKPCSSQRDLALAYTPGVAAPCEEIRDKSETAYHYTDKGNLIAAVTNGTAVPGLGDIGPHASKPYLESLSAVYKIVADLDIFDLEVASNDPGTIAAE
jgi:malate dehydrogenase (oxaloacetate-decarboxylating)(NADP+)